MGADGATTETEETGEQTETEETVEVIVEACDDGDDCPEETAPVEETAPIEDPDMGADGATLVKV